ncbi:MAG TPA: hypothetical protein VEI02_07560 [Planctomycetota bacterium]|nr:hypothetical protein [Planctomycetota bacterium]
MRPTLAAFAGRLVIHAFEVWVGWPTLVYAAAFGGLCAARGAMEERVGFHVVWMLPWTAAHGAMVVAALASRRASTDLGVDAARLAAGRPVTPAVVVALGALLLPVLLAEATVTIGVIFGISLLADSLRFLSRAGLEAVAPWIGVVLAAATAAPFAAAPGACLLERAPTFEAVRRSFDLTWGRRTAVTVGLSLGAAAATATAYVDVPELLFGERPPQQAAAFATGAALAAALAYCSAVAGAAWAALKAEASTRTSGSRLRRAARRDAAVRALRNH